MGHLSDWLTRGTHFDQMVRRIHPLNGAKSRCFSEFRVFMKFAVIGAGIVGITTAYELARDGHDVTVFERTGAAAERASFANTGVMSASMTAPWSIPTWPKPTAFHLFKSLQSVTLKKGVTQQDLRWLWAWGKKAGSAQAAANQSAAHALATYSQSRMQQITTEAALEFQRSEGHLLIVPTEASYQALNPTISALQTNGITFTELSPEQAVKLEPSLVLSEPIHCAIHLPQDSVGNCRQFALLLRAEAQKCGVKFQFGAEVTDISPLPNPSLTLRGLTTPIAFEGIVVCTGECTGALKTRLKIKQPIATVHGYSVSAVIREPLNAPKISIMDTDTQTVIARMGNRLRVSGGAELGGTPGTHDGGAIQSLFRTLHRYFPGAIQYPEGSQIWKGARILSSDGLPLVGASDTPGIWINLAHGGNGWGYACGCARLLADLIGRKNTAIDSQSFHPSRPQV